MAPPHIPTGSSIYGPIMIGVFFDTLLCGVFFLQAFTYFQKFKTDSRITRYMIGYLGVIEIVGTVLIFGIAYEPLIVHYGEDRVLRFVPTLLAADPLIISLVATPCQIFMGWRLGSTIGSRLLTFVITVFTFVSSAAAVTVSIGTILLKEWRQLESIKYAVLVWLVGSAVTDMMITGALVWFLHKSRTGLSRHDSVVNKIIFLTVQTGAITSLAAIADVLVFMISPGSNIQFIWDFSLSKLYSNALLSTLNSRQGWDRLIDSQPRAQAVSHTHSRSDGVSMESEAYYPKPMYGGEDVDALPRYIPQPGITYQSF